MVVGGISASGWLNIEHWSELTALLGGVSTGVVYMGSKLNVLRRMAAVARFPGRLTRMMDSVDDMRRELRPNHGSSIFDKIHTIADGTQEALSRLELVEQHQALAMATLQIVVDEQGIVQFQADLNGNRTWVGGAWQALTGLKPEDSIGTGWINAIASDEREAVMSAWEDAVAFRRPFFMTYHYAHAVTGERVLVRCEARPVKDGDSDIAGYAGTVRRARAADAPSRVA